MVLEKELRKENARDVVKSLEMYDNRLLNEINSSLLNLKGNIDSLPQSKNKKSISSGIHEAYSEILKDQLRLKIELYSSYLEFAEKVGVDKKEIQEIQHKYKDVLEKYNLK